MLKQRVKKSLLVILGTLSLSLGVAGVFLPVIPTTPFLLCTCACYMRSSKRLYLWLLRRKVIGAYIYNYITYRAVLKSTRTFSLILLWAALIISMLLMSNGYLSAFLALVGIGVSIHLFTLKTIRKSEMDTLSPDERASALCGSEKNEGCAIRARRSRRTG
jgi:hypothetical protein